MEIDLDQLNDLAARAEKDFDGSSYGQSVCRLHKQGQVNNRLKYCEGRDYVARRIVKLAQEKRGPQAIEKALAEIERKNENIKRSLVLTSADWQSYADGALSMVAGIRQLFSEN